MKVIDVARRLGTTPDTVRYYTRIGYLKPAIRPRNGYKSYSKSDEHRLRFILSARRLGFSVDDIGVLIRESKKGHSVCPLVRELIISRLSETEQLFADISDLRAEMKMAVREWESMPDKAPTGDVICHLIEQFAANKSTDSPEARVKRGD